MKAVIKMSTAILVTVLMTFPLAGCEKQKQVQSKKDLIYASENVRLEKELAELKDKDAMQQQQLQGCIEEKQHLRQQVEEGVKQQTQAMFSTLFQTFKNLNDENQRLKAQLQQLNESPVKSE